MSVLLFLVLAFTSVPGAQPSLEYTVGSQDRLSITVVDEPNLTRVVTVGGDGSFDYPFIGQVKAAGLTIRAIQQDITSRLKEKYLRNPQVSIEVESYRSQVVYVWGQVKIPGAVTLMGNITLTEALAKAGSPTADAGAYIEINRKPRGTSADPSAKPAPEHISMAELQNGRAQNILLADGDTVFVPKAEMFFITGYVKNGGPFLHQDGMTVSKALSMAGGVSEKGSRNRIRITRTVDGREVLIKDVKLDFLVRPGDSIEVLSRLW
ncbi:MAG TPA: polysaccharide biosynthesis/export family protein [Vicinamibacterales bacterium]|nr:polysaccharide biosynthesis/export family protein [Vicinamibacterales bacterium]